jgi:hypothetical protein
MEEPLIVNTDDFFSQDPIVVEQSLEGYDDYSNAEPIDPHHYSSNESTIDFPLPPDYDSLLSTTTSTTELHPQVATGVAVGSELLSSSQETNVIGKIPPLKGISIEKNKSSKQTNNNNNNNNNQVVKLPLITPSHQLSHKSTRINNNNNINSPSKTQTNNNNSNNNNNKLHINTTSTTATTTTQQFSPSQQQISNPHRSLSPLSNSSPGGKKTSPIQILSASLDTHTINNNSYNNNNNNNNNQVSMPVLSSKFHLLQRKRDKQQQTQQQYSNQVAAANAQYLNNNYRYKVKKLFLTNIFIIITIINYFSDYNYFYLFLNIFFTLY